MEPTDRGQTDSVLIASLDDQAKDALFARGQTRSYASGQTIFARGEAGGTILIITEGRVEISITALNGRRSVLNHMGPGEVLGEIALFDEGSRSADATAATPVRGLIITKRDLTQFLASHPDATMGLVAELCAKVRNASEMFEVQAHMAANARLARCLIRVAEKWGAEQADGSITIATPFSQTDIGELSGLARENVNRHLKAWTRDGLVAIDGRRLTLLDPEGLRDLAEI